tara:strand:- start:307 stop:696 length:390 start_codon:yes stop_codon:yes gene_type:complete
MKKAKEVGLLQNDINIHMENFDMIINESLKKIKKEYAQILIDEKHKLIQKIADGENLDINSLKTKYLKSKELTCITNIKTNLLDENEELLDKIIISDTTYYYENKDLGNVFDINSNIVGYYKNSTITFV